MSKEFSRDSPSFDSISQAAASPPQAAAPSVVDGASQAVDNVIYSDIGITTLLTRLKQSIASARDFAAFLKKRSTLEEEQATGLKRLAKAQLDNVYRAEVRGGSYARQLAEVLKTHERMADNGMQFALSLHQMHEDLTELWNNMERGRKQWKHEGLDAEKKASDAEQAMQKAKARYDSLAEDYDRARTGDSKGSRRIGLKGPKSAEQYEQDLLRKTQAADADYEEKVRQAKLQREHLLSKGRPDAVHALRDLINECDSALALQLQKFATFNEKLLLSNGLIVSPLKEGETSLSNTIVGIDDDTDLSNFIQSHSGKVTRPSDIVYEKHPTLAPKQQKPQQASTFTAPVTAQQPTATPPSLTVNTAPSQPSTTNSRYYQSTPVQPQPSVGQIPPSTFQSPSVLEPQFPTYRQGVSPIQQQQQAPIRGAYNGAPPYPVHSPSTPQQTTGIILPPVPSAVPAANSKKLITHPIIGLSLEELYTRDGIAVPMIVQKLAGTVQAFGLKSEGLYRAPGDQAEVKKLQEVFETSPSVEEVRIANEKSGRNDDPLHLNVPDTWDNNIDNVASLLKTFFNKLPDPLFTRERYNLFISAVQIESEQDRRVALHQYINDLPDAHYATLRFIMQHLEQVVREQAHNRMTSSNLAVCFAPCLMGTDQFAAIGLQARVVDIILTHVKDIFDYDD